MYLDLHAMARELEMSSDVLDWVEQRLADDDEIVQPLKKLWNGWHTFHDPSSFDEFAAVVLADERFEQMYSIDHDPKLEISGYFSGPRVKLRSREITPDYLLVILRRHSDQIAKVLTEASDVLQWDASVESSTELVETQITEALGPAFKPCVHIRRRRRKSRTKTA